MKQNRYPVLFDNDAGNWPTGDVRAQTLQEALKFAERWGLRGIVMASEPFVLAPRLVGWARDRDVRGGGNGLVLGSYGECNDIPEMAKVGVPLVYLFLLLLHLEPLPFLLLLFYWESC